MVFDSGFVIDRGCLRILEIEHDRAAAELQPVTLIDRGEELPGIRQHQGLDQAVAWLLAR